MLALRDCNLSALIASCLSRIAPLAKLRSLKVTAQMPETMLVRADGDRLERVVQNLLDNAVKFAPDGGNVSVRLLSKGNTDVIEVEDNGPGIAPEEQSQLFKRFSQGAVGKRYAGGSGLGLYLCKQIVEAHGGTIECMSQPNSATIFRVTLPKQTDLS
jgi:signal transduction histidine kinase